MGWVSYLEDITDRLTDDLNRTRATLARTPASDGAHIREEAMALLKACETALSDIRSHLELATDPHFDMAYEITQLDKEKAELEADVKSLTAKKAGLVTEIERLQTESSALKLELKHERRASAQKDRDFDQLAQRNMDAALERARFSSLSSVAMCKWSASSSFSRSAIAHQIVRAVSVRSSCTSPRGVGALPRRATMK
jgi:chromosome segregation ATPase